MKMKVHQTLVWLNLLSLGTKGLTKPTIGIQSGLCHGRGLARTASQQHSLTTLIRHFVSIKPAYTVPPSCLSQRYCVSERTEDLPAGPVRVCVYPQHHTHKRPDLFNAGRASTARRAWDLATLSVHHTQGQTHTHCPEDLPAGPVRVCVYGVCSCCRACVTSYT